MASTPGFELLLLNLQDLGIEIFLHIVLFVAIYFGLLRKTEVIGDDEGVQGASAVALSLLTTIGIYSFLPASTLTAFFAGLSAIVILILGLMIVMGMFGVNVGEVEINESQRSIGVVALAVVLIIVLIVVAPIVENQYGANVFGEDATSFVLTLGMIAIIGYMVKYIGTGDG